MMWKRVVLIPCLLVVVDLFSLNQMLCVEGQQQYDSGDQDYGQQDYPQADYSQPDFSQDNLYHDYAARQQEKAVGVGVGPLGGGWGKFAVGGAVGWFLGGKFHSRRLQKKLNAKHKEDQKAVYTQYYNDVFTLTQQNADLINALEKAGVRIR